MKKLRTWLALVATVCAVLALPAAAEAATPGKIAGKVTSASSGSPVAFLDVCAYKAATHETGGCDFTDSSGEYLIENLEAGSYKVEFRAEPFEEAGEFKTQWYNNKPSFETANAVVVTEGNTTTGINAALQERGGKISGTVTDATNGSAIDGIEACASLISSTEFYFGYDCVRTSGGGNYTLLHLQAGSYRVEFRSPYKYNEGLERSELEGPNYVSQYYSGQNRPESATGVNVTEGQTSANINAALQPGGTISGTVTDAVTGGALQAVSACAWGATEYLCAQTGNNGQYAIATLPAGTYKIEFTPEYFFNKASYKEGKRVWMRSEFPLMEYARQYYNNKVAFAAAEPVTAAAGATTANINAKMVKETQPAAAPGTAVIGKKAKVKGGKALLSIKCQGTGPCKGILQLTVQEKAAAKRKAKKAKSVVIGRAPFAIQPGKTAVVRVKLNAKGKALLSKAGKKGLKAKVTGKGLKTGAVLLTGQSR